ncbi:MAG TPA: hypothetical protein VFK54_02170 [Candidatus Limnocylindrales bacterium]|nr:hypothetical protein [Candidatus Limnocylindrales bacterium]
MPDPMVIGALLGAVAVALLVGLVRRPRRRRTAEDALEDDRLQAELERHKTDAILGADRYNVPRGPGRP